MSLSRRSGGKGVLGLIRPSVWVERAATPAYLAACVAAMLDAAAGD
jgi:hypothetical protein